MSSKKFAQQLERLKKLDAALSGPDWCTTRQLEKKLGISERQLKRDFALLRELGKYVDDEGPCHPRAYLLNILPLFTSSLPKETRELLRRLQKARKKPAGFSAKELTLGQVRVLKALADAGW